MANLEAEAARLSAELTDVDAEARHLLPQADEVAEAEARLATEVSEFEAEWLIALPERIEQRPMPEVELIDMRQEFLETRKQATFSGACWMPSSDH